jgi:hypothetical protein
VNKYDPPDEVLLELGRLVWAAINLEGIVYSVCRSVQPRGGPYDKSNIGPRIDKARDDLLARPDDERRARADAWLAEAQAALMDRNSILHATPGTFVRVDRGGPPQESGPYFLHLPKDKTRPSVNTPLSVDALRQIRKRLEMAAISWTELASDLWEHRPAAT